MTLPGNSAPTKAQHALLWEINAGRVSMHYAKPPEARYEREGKVRTDVWKNVKEAGWVTVPSRQIGQYGKNPVSLTPAGREALNARIH